VAVLYRRWKEPSIVRRVLDPLGIVLKAGRWYLVALIDGDGAPRTYRVGQVLEAEVTGESFERPAGFDLALHWQASLAGFRERLQQGEAVIRLSPRGRDRAADAYPANVMAAIRRTESRPDPAGWVTATVPIESLTHAESEFLKLGPDVEVVAPLELRNRIAATSRNLAAMYAGESA
jgi:predicted DNA-binding transcriptional regulator YafY